MEKSRTGKFLINTVYAASYQIILIVAGFIIPRVMLKYYGSEINGLVSSITQFISYFNLVEAGLSGAAIFALYKPLSYKNYSSINEIISATQKMYIKSGWIFCFLILTLSLIYPLFVTCEGLTRIQITLLVFVLGTTGIIEFFTLGKYRALLTADQKLYVISFASICYQVFSVLIIIVGSFFKLNIVAVRALAIAPVVLRSFILIIYCKFNYKYLNYKASPNYDMVNKRWDAFFLQILGAIHSGAPVILATVFTDLKSVSVYTIYNVVLSGINGLLGIFTNGLSSSFGEIIAKNESDTLKRTYKEFMTIYYMLIVIIYGISHRLILPFIKLYTRGINDAEYINYILAIVFVLNGFLYNLKTPQGMLVISAGHYKETKIQTTIQGLLAVVLGGLWARKWGLVGIVLGSIVSNIYRCLDLAYYIPKKITKTSVKDTLIRMIISIVILGIIIIINNATPLLIETWVEWFLFAVKYSLILTVILIFIMSTLYAKEVKGVINHLKCTVIKGVKNEHI